MQKTRGKLGGVTTALVMLVVMLGALVLPASPAHAAGYWPDQCVEDLWNGEPSPRAIDYDRALHIEDVNVRVENFHAWRDVDLFLLVSDGGTRASQLSTAGGLWEGDAWTVTFDEEADTAYGEVRGPDAVMRPYREIGSFFPARTGFRLATEPWGGGVPMNVSFSVRVTYNDCDPDRDGVPNAMSDNCDGVANRDQADRDGDGTGDACDPDNDNDGVADAGDNCPLATNGDQADFDRDGAGDACDGDDDNDGYPDTGDSCPRAYGNPCPPPPPTAQPNPTNPTTPTAPGGGTTGPVGVPLPTSAPPPVRRSVVLDVKRRRVLEGAVSSAASACTSRVHVRVLRKQKGRDSVVVKTRAGLRGAFKAKLGKPLRPGRYYARLRPEELPGPILCSSDRSDVVRVRRR